MRAVAVHEHVVLAKLHVAYKYLVGYRVAAVVGPQPVGSLQKHLPGVCLSVEGTVGFISYRFGGFTGGNSVAGDLGASG